jgi:hypothetical protein
MSKEYFADNLSTEDIAEMTDEMLRFESVQKTGKKKSYVANLLKIIPAAAALLLVIGLADFMGVLPDKEDGGGNRNGIIPVPGALTVIEERDIFDAEPEESEFFTYEELKEYIENEKIYLRSFIGYTGENWMAVSGQPVYTQEMYEADAARFEKMLENARNGELIPRYKPLAEYVRFYDTLDESMNLNAGITFTGRWVLFNSVTGNGSHSIIEIFDSKEEMLERAREYLGRAVMAGVIDMIQSNDVYRRLYNADENNIDYILTEWEETVSRAYLFRLPDASMVELAYNRGYRDSMEYTRFRDSTFARRMHSLSEEENDFIRRCLFAGENLPVADDIIGMGGYDTDDNRMIVVLELKCGDTVEFKINLD